MFTPPPPPEPASTSAPSPSSSTPRLPKAPKVPKPPKAKAVPTRSSKLRGNPTESLAARLSKTVTYLLRHGAAGQGLELDGEGWCSVEELLDHPALKTNGLLFPALRDIVAEDKKTRTALEHRGAGATAGDRPEGWFIRANQGHSVKLDAMEDGMKRVTEVAEAGEAVHGTTGLDAWKGIYANGLSKMSRQHIHLALSTPLLPTPTHTPSTSRPSSPSQASDPASSRSTTKQTSGIRSSSTHLLYLDVPLLLSHNVPLFLSTNSVLLSPGDPLTPGSIGRKFFLRFVERRTGEVVWERGTDDGNGTTTTS